MSPVSTTVPFVKAKPTVPSVTPDTSSKTKSASPDATSDTTFQASSVKSVKMAALIVKDQEPVSSVKPVDTPTTDCAMSTAQPDQSLKLPT